MAARLTEGDLYARCDPAQFEFETTEELEDLPEPLGQARAIGAIRFGVGIVADGYHLVAIGADGTGKREVVTQILEREAAGGSPPSDWCYVEDFDDSRTPRLLELAAGNGQRFRAHMTGFIDEIRSMLPALLEDDAFRRRATELASSFQTEQRGQMLALQKEAEAQGLSMMQTPQGFAFAPAKDGQVMEREEYEALPEGERARIDALIEEMNQRLLEMMQTLPQRQRAFTQQQTALAREFTERAVNTALASLRRTYEAHPEVLKYLAGVRDDVIENAPRILAQETSAEAAASSATSFYQRYRVNLVVDNGSLDGAPVVYESNPSVENLVGRVEHRPVQGGLVTDFSMIRGGALHRANGGYLVLDVERVLTRPFAWDALKRALADHAIRIESVAQMYQLGYTVSLDPEPIRLEVKVVLLCSRLIYYMLSQLDIDFSDLFKVAADFEDRMVRDEASAPLYARLIASLARESRVGPVHRSAVARIVEHASRHTSDQERLTTHTRMIVDLLVESAFMCKERDGSAIEAADVQEAIDRRIHRMDRVRRDAHEAISRDTVLIQTSGAAVGQINGLSVVQAGGVAFGQPSRITATVRLGRGAVIDIERESKLGGNIHSKGVMIVSSFIGSRYAADLPLSMTASLVFEQSYGGVDGDSASVAEVSVLVSALTGLPVKQSLAVTGSMNQRGEVQAIGGVNEKIEGFFDVCRARRLTGEQGVLIPADNVKHLMLRHDVRAAVAARQFSVTAIDTIDEALTLLLGRDAGVAEADGNYPPESVNGLARARVVALSKLSRRRAAEDESEGAKAEQEGAKSGEDD